MHHRFVLDLPDLTFQRLAELAERERRPVRDQAGLLLERMLKRRAVRHGGDTPRLPALVGQNSEA